MRMDEQEHLDGYIVDVACLRKYRQDELLERAREHTRDCALHGHCIESGYGQSGYGLVTDDGRVLLLDPKATPLVVDHVETSDPQEGIRVQVTRQREDGEMVTREVSPPSSTRKPRASPTRT